MEVQESPYQTDRLFKQACVHFREIFNLFCMEKKNTALPYFTTPLALTYILLLSIAHPHHHWEFTGHRIITSICCNFCRNLTRNDASFNVGITRSQFTDIWRLKTITILSQSESVVSCSPLPATLGGSYPGN